MIDVAGATIFLVKNEQENINCGNTNLTVDITIAVCNRDLSDYELSPKKNSGLQRDSRP